MPSIQATNQGAIIEGELTVGVIPAFLLEGYAIINKAQTALTFDFSKVTRVDSASLALLIEWFRHAKKAQKKLSFIHLPEKIEQMMKLSNLVF